MAETIDAAEKPRSIHRWNQADAAWEQVVIPSWARRVAITFAGQAGFVSHTVTDSDAFTNAVAQLAEDVPADTIYSVPLTDGKAPTPQQLLFVRVAVAGNITVTAEASEVG